MKIKRETEEYITYLTVLKKWLNVSSIRSSQSRSNIRTQDRTFATVSSMETLLANKGLSISSSLAKDCTTTVKTS
jgi:hypothetical protein